MALAPRPFDFTALPGLNARTPMKRSLAAARAFAATALLALTSAPALQCAEPAANPNVIFILADDLGYGDLGCYGQKLIQTPHLDRMAREGMRFTQFYAGSTVCAPSRSVLMTGQHTGHTRVRGNAGTQNPLAQSLRPGDFTVAHLFKSAGYSTALVGKWGLGDEGEAAVGMPTRQGFDYFFGYLNQHHAHNYWPAYLIRGEQRFPLRNEVPGGDPANLVAARFGRGWAGKKLDYSHDLLAEDALKWIEAQAARPFFLYLALTTPHANNEATRGTGNGQEVPDLGIYADKDWTPQNKGQAAMITRMDRDVGRLFELLKRRGIDEKTVVFFSSDNGNHKEGGNDPEFFDANGPLNGMKRSLTDGGIRVPFLARWPGRIKPGVVPAHVGYFGDFLATAADLTGAKLTTPHDGISFAPTLLGDDAKQKKHEHLYWEFHEGGFSQAVVMDGRWKAIRMRQLVAPVQLFDLATDIGETKNLAADKPELVARARELFKSARADSPDWPIREGAADGAKKKGKQ
jgi:uncharacterized sulfatase